jgi:L-fuculose-phosphate aldolase
MNPAGTPAKQQALSQWSKRLHENGWVANHDGNISMRGEDGVRYTATPTATSKAFVEPHDMVIVDLDGKKLHGRKRLFSEWHLHAACYRARPDVMAVVHAHPPFATAVGLAGQSMGVPALPEMVVSLGANIPTLARAMPKSPAQDKAIEEALTTGDADGLLLAGNGVLCVGQDVEQAFLRMELIEHYASILSKAMAFGGVTPLAGNELAALLSARTRAGLGAAGRGSK